MCPRVQVPRWEFTSAAYPQINIESALPSGPWLSQYLIQGPASIQGLCAESLSIKNKPHLLRGQKALPTPREIWTWDQGTPDLAKRERETHPAWQGKLWAHKQPGSPGLKSPSPGRPGEHPSLPWRPLRAPEILSLAAKQLIACQTGIILLIINKLSSPLVFAIR